MSISKYKKWMIEAFIAEKEVDLDKETFKDP